MPRKSAGIIFIIWGVLIWMSQPILAATNYLESENLEINGERLQQRIDELAKFSKPNQAGTHRVAFSEEDLQGREYLIELMRQAGMQVRIDTASNIIGRREGKESLPPILFGSHSDTVPNGGKYDGALGVLSAIECVQVLQEEGYKTRHPLEVVVFTDEEGGLIGSRALVGELTSEALNIISHSGKTIREGIRFLGGDPNALTTVIRKKGEIKAFVEIHVEQGGTLEKKGIDIGIVAGIVGINWWDVTITGTPNHAGTTPMNMRQDAMLAAAHFTIAVNEVVRSLTGSQVGTVGRIKAEPGAPNVIPGKVILSLELRDLSAEKIAEMFELIKQETRRIEAETGTRFSFSPIDATAVPAPTDPKIQKYIQMAAEKLGLSALVMPSGAGHDAQEMARIAPIGMIFVPSVGGTSHSPKEFTPTQDMINGANVLLQTILLIDRN